MLSKFKVVLFGVLALFAFAVATSSASATPTWLVNGTKVATGAKFTIAEVAGLAAGNKLTFEKGEAELSCTGATVQAGWIEGASKNGAEHIIFTDCTAAKPAHCAVKNGTVTTAEVRSELLASETKPTVTFKPLNTSTELFATFKLESSGGTCALNGKEFKVTGIANAEILKPTEDAVLKEISANTGVAELKVNGEEANLIGVASLKLSVGLLWGVA